MRKVRTSAVSTRIGSSRQNEPFLRLDSRCRCTLGPRESPGSSSRAGSVERARWATSSGYRQATGAAGSGRGRRLTLLLDLRCLTTEIPKVVQLGAPDITAGDDLYLGDVRGMHRKGALHTHTERHLAHGERLPRSRALPADDRTLEDLYPLARPLDDADVHLERVTGPEVGDVGPQRLRVQGVQGVHRQSILVFKCCARCGAPWRARTAAWATVRTRALGYPLRRCAAVTGSVCQTPPRVSK